MRAELRGVIVMESRRTCLRRWFEAGTGLSKRPAPDNVAERVPAEDGHGCGPGGMFQELKEPPGQRVAGSGEGCHGQRNCKL